MNTRERDFLIWVEVQALTAELEGMKAENDQRMVLGQSMAYGKDHFDEIADRMRSAGDKFKTKKCVVCGGTDCDHLTGANNMVEAMFGCRTLDKNRVRPGVALKEIARPYSWGCVSFDHEGFKKAREERWEPAIGPGTVHCKKHNVTFKFIPEEGVLDAEIEPCWECYNEFEIRK